MSDVTATPKSRKRLFVGGIAFVAGLVMIALTLAFLFGFGGSIGANITDTSANDDGASNGTVAFDPKTDRVLEEARCKNNDYINSSIQSVKTGDNAYRQYGTAVSIPFKGETDEAITTEILAEVCGNPTFLKMVVDDMLLWTGFPGADDNKAWLTEINTDLTTNGFDSFLAKKTEDGGIIVSEKFQEHAGWVNTVLLRFNEEGKQPLSSVRNWELPATVDPTEQPTAVLASTVDSKPAWVRTLKDKNGTCLYTIGFNAEDKRLEVFDCTTPPVNPPVCLKVDGCITTPPPATPPCEETGTCDCINVKCAENDVPAPGGWTPLGPGTPQPNPPVKTDLLDPATPVNADPGTTVPVGGATPAPPAPPAPTIPTTQAPPPTTPGTPITDPDG